MALRFDNVTLRHGAFSLQADWEVGAGITALVGASGAGKSSLLSLIGGFLEPVDGEVVFDGVVLNGLAPADRPVATLFQDNNLFPHLTLAQNVGLGLGPRRLGDQQKGTVMEALVRVGLPELADRKPGQVSGGQQSRAALARVLLQDRPVVCLDEPFAALGPGQRAQMMDLTARVLAGRVVIVVSHDPAELRGMADQAVFVDQGKAAAPVPMGALLDNPPEALARYLGIR